MKRVIIFHIAGLFCDATHLEFPKAQIKAEASADTDYEDMIKSYIDELGEFVRRIVKITELHQKQEEESSLSLRYSNWFTPISGIDTHQFPPSAQLSLDNPLSSVWASTPKDPSILNFNFELLDGSSSHFIAESPQPLKPFKLDQNYGNIKTIKVFANFEIAADTPYLAGVQMFDRQGHHVLSTLPKACRKGDRLRMIETELDKGELILGVRANA